MKDWKAILTTLNAKRIQEAKNYLKGMLGVDNLAGKTFLDVNF